MKSKWTDSDFKKWIDTLDEPYRSYLKSKMTEVLALFMENPEKANLYVQQLKNNMELQKKK
ncbi:hypothetical protein [Bacillus sp. FJAT-52991]|uniref:Uncharacterized protein n=1 Tax=Bacillus kandeliae TaxID=3129297 RepID=A0ABZ2N1H3_9BACI